MKASSPQRLASADPVAAPLAPEAALRPRTATDDARHLDLLLGISRAIGTIVDQTQLIKGIVEHVTTAFGADRTTLFVHDRQRRQLWSRVAQGLDQASILRIPEDQGIAGTVFTTREPLLIHDTFKFDQFNRAAAERLGYVPRSMLVVPVCHLPDRVDGVLQVLDRRVGYFRQAELDLAMAIATQVSISLDNARLYEAQRLQFESFVGAMSKALDARDPSTQEHSINVANYAMGIAYYLGLPQVDQDYLRIAGLLHDIGKIGTPEAILTKPGKLTDAEYAEMKRHAAHSRTILSHIAFTDHFADIPQIAPAHHEKLDGTGYPQGLMAANLPLKARILCVADIADALTQDRYYRKGMTVEQAMKIIDGMVPEQLDGQCVAALRKFLGATGVEDGG